MMRPLRYLLVAQCVTLLASCGRSDEPQPAVPVRTEPARTLASEDTARSSDDIAPAAVPDPGSARRDVPATPAAEMPADSPPASTQDPGLRLLEGAAARYAAIRSLSADFAMDTRNPLLRESIRSRGKLFQRRPDRILLRFEDPAGDVIAGDGRYFWVWYPSVDSTQAVRTPASAGAGGVDLLAQFVGDPVQRFRWTVRGTESVAGRPATILGLEPRGEEAYAELVVWIDNEDFLVRRFEVTEHSGVVRRIDLRGITIDPDLPDSLFRFDPPPGVRIVGAP